MVRVPIYLGAMTSSALLISIETAGRTHPCAADSDGGWPREAVSNDKPVAVALDI
jgi:hypothetical protein